MKMQETKREGGMVYFEFSCPGCGAEGELGLDLNKDGHKPFGCPDGCGSTFVPWLPDAHGLYKLTCVVQRMSAWSDSRN